MTRLETFRALFGDLARPFSIYVSSAGASIATVRLAWMAHAGDIELNSAGFFIAAVWGGVCALYWGKSWEKNTEVKASAEVEKSKTTPAPPAPGTANVQAAPDVTVTVSETGDPPRLRGTDENLEDPA